MAALRERGIRITCQSDALYNEAGIGHQSAHPVMQSGSAAAKRSIAYPGKTFVYFTLIFSVTSVKFIVSVLSPFSTQSLNDKIIS